MWRTTGDINDSWESILDIGFKRQAGLEAYAGPGRWNDPDMLVVGMYGKGNVAQGGCTDAEYRSHFSLWCLLASPLMIGCDVRAMRPTTRQTLLNREAIAIDQDPLGRQGHHVGAIGHGGETASVWAKPLEDGSVAAGLFNLGERDARLMVIGWESIGIHDQRPCLVRDLWAQQDLGTFTSNFTTRVGRHDVALLRITPVS